MSSNTFEKAFRENLSQVKEQEAKRSDEEKQRQTQALAERLSGDKAVQSGATKPKTH